MIGSRGLACQAGQAAPIEAPRRRGSRRLLLPVLLIVAAALACLWTEAPRGCLPALPADFVGPTPPRALTSAASAAGSDGRLLQVGASAGVGFSSTTGVVVPEPADGWPTLSVIVLGMNTKGSKKQARGVALKQLAAQDYPKDLIKEIIVGGGKDAQDGVPEALQGHVRDFGHADPATLNLQRELSLCTGDMVAIWADDHISPEHRLKAQVTEALQAGAASVLRAGNYYDPLIGDFRQVERWQMIEDKTEAKKFYATDTENFDDAAARAEVELESTSDHSSICCKKTALLEAVDKIQFASPKEELKDLVVALGPKHTRQVMDLPWVSVKMPPEDTLYDTFEPEKDVQDMVQAVWPVAEVPDDSSMIEAVLQEIVKEKPGPGEVIKKVLKQDIQGKLGAFDERRIQQAIFLSLGEGERLADAVQALKEWEGLEQGLTPEQQKKAIQQVPLFWAAFTAVRTCLDDNVEFLEVRQLGRIAEELGKLPKKIIWANAKIDEALSKYRMRDVRAKEKRIRGALDFTASLNLRNIFDSIGNSALHAGDGVTLDTYVALAEGMSEAGVPNPGLAMKVVRSVMANMDKLTPEYIGELWKALKRDWFTDDTAIGYLTEALKQRIAVLRKEDKGLEELIQRTMADYEKQDEEEQKEQERKAKEAEAKEAEPTKEEEEQPQSR